MGSAHFSSACADRLSHRNHPRRASAGTHQASRAAKSAAPAAARKKPTGKEATAKRTSSTANPRNAAEEWDCDVVMYPNVTKQADESGEDAAENEWGEPIKAPFFPYVLMVVDHHNNIGLCTDMTRQPGEYADQLGATFLDFLEENGLPAHLYVRNDRAYALLSGIAEKLGIPLTQKKHLPMLEEVLADFYEHTVGKEDDESDEEETASFLKQLADPAYLKALPNPLLRQVANEVRTFDPAMLPEGLLENVAAELQSRGMKG